MPSAAAPSLVTCTGGSIAGVETDLLVVPWFQDEPASAVPGLDAAVGGEVSRALSAREFQAKAFDFFFAAVADRAWKARRVALIGGGPGERGTELMRKLATAAALSARGKHVTRAAFVIRGSADAASVAQAVAEGLTLGEFYSGIYKTGEPPPGAPP